MARRKKRKSLHPNVTLRPQPDGTIRPRFTPGPIARRKGAVPQDLKNADGSWMTLGQVIDWCKNKSAPGTASGTASSSAVRDAVPAQQRRWTVNDLLDDFFKSKDFNRPQSEGGYSDKSRDGYKTSALAIRFKPMPLKGRKRDTPRESEPFALEPARNHDAANVKAFFLHLEEARGLAMARQCIMILSAAYKWGRLDANWRLKHNPCHQLDLASPGADLGLFDFSEFALLRESALELDRFSVRLACSLGLFSPGRPSDVIRYTGGAITEGMVRLQQGKRGKGVVLPALPILRQDLAEARERRIKSAVMTRALVWNERTGEGYTPGEFDKAFAEVRAHAVAKLRASGTPEDLEAAAVLEQKKFKYFRKTLYTWLTKAGNDVAKVGKLLGHSASSINEMAKHYLLIDDSDAREAMGKLEVWMQKQGMAG